MNRRRMPGESFVSKLRWYHATRATGIIVVLYELLFAQGTAERGTIIVAGLGLFGYDLATRKDKGA